MGGVKGRAKGGKGGKGGREDARGGEEGREGMLEEERKGGRDRV